jgi:uncharacterized protein (DUF924 family)
MRAARVRNRQARKEEAIMAGREDVLDFWLEELDEADWYRGGDDLDALIRERFTNIWEQASRGELDGWCDTPEGTLAFLIVTEQFPRNMFRGTAKAFSTDPRALSAAKAAVAECRDWLIDMPERQFFYLPLEHSEDIADQHRAVRLIATRMRAPETLLHARAHRWVIDRFGRFPYRNAALGRETRPPEESFLAEGGYRLALDWVRAAREHGAPA